MNYYVKSKRAKILYTNKILQMFKPVKSKIKTIHIKSFAFTIVHNKGYVCISSFHWHGGQSTCNPTNLLLSSRFVQACVLRPASLRPAITVDHHCRPRATARDHIRPRAANLTLATFPHFRLSTRNVLRQNCTYLQQVLKKNLALYPKQLKMFHTSHTPVFKTVNTLSDVINFRISNKIILAIFYPYKTYKFVILIQTSDAYKTHTSFPLPHSAYTIFHNICVFLNRGMIYAYIRFQKGRIWSRKLNLVILKKFREFSVIYSNVPQITQKLNFKISDNLQ